MSEIAVLKWRFRIFFVHKSSASALKVIRRELIFQIESGAWDHDLNSYFCCNSMRLGKVRYSVPFTSKVYRWYRGTRVSSSISYSKYCSVGCREYACFVFCSEEQLNNIDRTDRNKYFFMDSLWKQAEGRTGLPSAKHTEWWWVWRPMAKTHVGLL